MLTPNKPNWYSAESVGHFISRLVYAYFWQTWIFLLPLGRPYKKTEQWFLAGFALLPLIIAGVTGHAWNGLTFESFTISFGIINSLIGFALMKIIGPEALQKALASLKEKMTFRLPLA